MSKQPKECTPRRTLYRSLCIIAAFLGGALSASAGQASSDDSPFELVEQLARVLVLIEGEYVDAVSRERLLQGAVKGMVAELDPHSSYLPAQDFDILQDDTRGEFAGIGVEVDFRNDRVTIISPIDSSPAARAGLRPGDVIIAIDGESVHGKSAADLVKMMRGPRGSEVEVSVRRANNNKPLRFRMAREVIEVASVLGAPLDKGVAYFRIKQFQAKTHRELLEAIAAVRAAQSEVKGIILDLRNNPGGLVRAATGVADEFLDGGGIYSTRHREQTVSRVDSRAGGALTEPPMVVLVNEFSASASELLAGALQDNRRATVVGARTFGKGSVQSIIDLPDGAGLRLTTMRYYTPRGRAIQVQGIEPEVAVSASQIESVRIVREAHLDNHLRGESHSRGQASADGAAPPRATNPDGSEEEESLPETHLGVARTIPPNPIGGPDEALGVAYRVVLEKMAHGGR